MEIKKKLILELNSSRFIIRKLVFDIIDIFKKNEEGDFFLPEDINDEHFYEFKKLKDGLQIELTILPDYKIDTFLVNAEYYNEETIISIKIVYNPEKKNKIIYNLIGELNEIIAHELRHNYQYSTNMFDFKNMSKDQEESVDYYTQPHEIDAQVYGFRRLSKIRKIPFESVVKDWFDTHQDIHQMNKKNVDYVIKKIIEKNNLY